MSETVPLNAIIAGEAGPAVVILHGLLGSARNWRSIARRLAGGGRRVHALDLRNHGQSPWADDTGYAAMAADVERHAAAAGLEAPAVLGHSMGGKVAMVLALTRPASVGALVVADVAPVRYQSAFGPWIAAMRAIDAGALKRRAEAEARLAPAVPDAIVRAFLAQNLETDGDGLRWRPNLDALAAGLETDILGFPDLPASARYEGPALFLRGERSDYVRPAHHDAIRARFPAAEFAVVPDAGHWLHAENPRAFLAALDAFLRRAGR